MIKDSWRPSAVRATCTEAVSTPVTVSQWDKIGLAALLLSEILTGQPPQAEPSFDVVSIRSVPSNAPPILRSQDFTPVLPGGQYVDSQTMLFFMITFAYNVKNPSKQLVGLPNWAQNQGYSVSAKAAPVFPALSPAENREQVRLMMRTMLADRFQLRIHTETRQERIFSLKVAKGGLKIPEVDRPVPPEKEGPVNAAMSDTGGRMIGNKSTMAGMAIALAIFLKHPVKDETGLHGYYDFDVRWRAPEPRGGQSGGLGTEGIGLLLSMLRDRFGLQVANTTGPVEYWVVDHVAPPTAN